MDTFSLYKNNNVSLWGCTLHFYKNIQYLEKFMDYKWCDTLSIIIDSQRPFLKNSK